MQYFLVSGFELYKPLDSHYNNLVEISERKTILKYLNITLYSFSKICHFVSGKISNDKIRTRIMVISASELYLRLDDKPKNFTGYLVFHSYTYIFRFKTKLIPGSESGIYKCKIPEKIETYDQRIYSRLIFESKENKIITAYNDSLKESIKAILTDISAGGIGFIVVDQEQLPKIDDLIAVKLKFSGIEINTFVKVLHLFKDKVGCSFLDKSNKFQIELNKAIIKEIEWRSELVLRQLKKREELIQKLKKSQTDAKEDTEKGIDLGFVEELNHHLVNVFSSATGITLLNPQVRVKEETAVNFVTSLHFNLYIKDIPFKCFLYLEEKAIYKLAKAVFRGKSDNYVANANSILSALGEKIIKITPGTGEIQGDYKLKNPAVVEANRRLSMSFSKQPSIQVRFTSDVGEMDLVLLADNLFEAAAQCSDSREFITMEKMELIEPISFSTISVFADLLNLEIREKSVVTRDRLLPKFEVTVILDIFLEGVDGKVVLNMSKKLALKIYEILTEEIAPDFDDNVKDAIGELINMITGNAKNEFEKSGIYYKLSTPVVIQSREKTVIFTRNMSFLSSYYWTSEGFFELSFSFFKT